MKKKKINVKDDLGFGLKTALGGVDRLSIKEKKEKLKKELESPKDHDDFCKQKVNRNKFFVQKNIENIQKNAFGVTADQKIKKERLNSSAAGRRIVKKSKKENKTLLGWMAKGKGEKKMMSSPPQQTSPSSKTDLKMIQDIDIKGLDIEIEDSRVKNQRSLTTL